MAKITILGRDFDLAPFKLADMRIAAPYIDHINASAENLSTLEGLAEAAGNLCTVLSIGLVKIDPTLTPEYLESEISLSDLPALKEAFVEILRDAGIAAPAGAAAAPKKAAAAA